MGMGFAPTWLRQMSPPPHLLHKTTLTTGENNMLRVRRHLFHEFLFVYLSFLPDTDVTMTVQYFVCCITHSFQL